MRRSWLRLFWAGVIVVGAAAGFLATTGLGERLLHGEIETQLTRLLRGRVEIGDVEVHFDGGFRVEAREIEAFPSDYYAVPPALRARRLVAWIDVLALLVGRLELSTLVLETPVLRVTQDADGEFIGLPLPAIDFGPFDTEQTSRGEAIVARIESLDTTAAAFFESTGAADRIEIQDGTVLWQQPSSEAPGAPTSEIRLELVSMLLTRDWLSDSVGLELSAVVLDGEHSPFPVGAVVERTGAEASFDWTLSVSQIPLAAAETPLAFVEGIEGLSGQLTTAIHLGDAPDGSRRLEIGGGIHNGSIELRRSRTRIEREEITFNTEIEIGTKRLRIREAHIEGKQLGIDFKGSIRRPISGNSAVRLESRLVGFELDDISELATSIAEESPAARSITRLVERVEGGHILYVEGSGTASLGRWQDLMAGRVKNLPDGFVLGGAFRDVTVAAGPDDRIEQLGGKVEWIEDQITLSETTATFRGSKLPEMNLVLEGVSNLGRAPESALRIQTNPPPIPGLAPLVELIKPRNPNALPPVKAIALVLDRLDHPVFRWPIRNLKVLIEPRQRGMEAHIREGLWGAAAVTGDVVWHSNPESPSVSANLVIGTDTSSGASGDAATKASALAATTVPREEQRWGEGRFELEFRPRPYLPFKKASGFVRLEGTKLVANEVQFLVESQGQLASRIVLDLVSPEQVGVDLSFALTDGRLEQVSEFIALPPDLATGELGATGTLRGSVRPGESLISKLDGRIRVEAQSGIIRTKVPLLLRLSKASEGFNPFADEDELSYEALAVTIDFREGTLLAEDFEIEGPLRIYARGLIKPLAKPSQVRGVVGIFLFRAPNQILESLPLVRYFLPGSERGLVGAYFDVKGALSEPDVESLTIDSLMTAVPAAIKAPFKVLQYLFDPSEGGS